MTVHSAPRRSRASAEAGLVAVIVLVAQPWAAAGADPTLHLGVVGPA